MAVGLKEIASDLNLGLSTVAQALGGRGTISPRTRRLVVEHAAKLGYTPNRLAQRMRQDRTGVIGLIVPDVVLSPYVEVVQHLFQMVEAKGLELQIALTEFYSSMEDRAFKSMLSSRVDGVIAKVGFHRWEDVPGDHYLRRARDMGVPVVLYSNPIAGSGLPHLIHPMFESVKLVVRHLVGLGHRRIAAMVPAVKPFGGAMQGWLTAIREELTRIAPDVRLQIVGLPMGTGDEEGPRGVFKEYVNQNHPQHAIPAGRYLYRQAMSVAEPPTALIAYADPVAIGAIFQAQAEGLKIGRDVAIAGCAQLATSHFCPISLTSVDRRPRVYAEKLLGMLCAHIDPKTRPGAPGTDEVEPLLVIGESTVGG
ncbi:MAG TPA: LacI family DNA-binding transcriptional regulator [Tepidisphaeraceae bacterium]|jgi:LacI family transcriptional regulator